jgi:glucosamine 6-phosphate synthetase-like amidotransferase/phosphosugar isomerase protein
VPQAVIEIRLSLVDKGNYRHFMAKEIYDQPEVVGRTFAHYVDLAAGSEATSISTGRRASFSNQYLATRPA